MKMDPLWKNSSSEKVGFRNFFIAVHMILFFFICSCNAGFGTRSEKSVLDETGADQGNRIKNAHLKIISKGIKKQDSARTHLLIKFIQYSIDGNLIEAHDITKDYERTVDLAPGKHFLHVERLQRGILSARALILDEGDCYVFTLSDEQSGVFEGAALPGVKWETNGFTGVVSWEKMDRGSSCTD